MINCPECKGRGHLVAWAEFPTSTKRIDCHWCKGTTTIDPEAWIEYQPHRQRPKLRLDIRLKSGKILTNTYPNGVHFSSNHGVISDDEVVAVRLSDHWTNKLAFKKVADVDQSC